MRSFVSCLWLAILGFLVVPTQVSAQLSPKRLFDLGTSYMAAGRYAEALDMFQKYQQAEPGNLDVLTNIGVCLFETNQITQARSFLEGALQDRKATPKIAYYIARTYHMQSLFKEAALQYKEYLRLAPKSDPLRAEVLFELRRCASGLHLKGNKSAAIVENLGPTVNTSFDEFGAIQSPNNPDRLYFSSIRESNVGGLRTEDGLRDDSKGGYSADMFATRYENDGWTKASVFNTLLNSPRHDILSDFSPNGKQLYFYRGFTMDNGQFFVDTFKSAEERNLMSTEMTTPINAAAGDKDLYIFSDTAYLFSSNRAGGYGGYDLYITVFTKGKWTPPINLGPSINSRFNEITPFLAMDGRTLYFSSDNVNSMGGYDIFKSVFNDLEKWWTEPQNLGLPINSPADDTHLRLSKDAASAFFTSARKDGLGMRDIYLMYYPSGAIHEQTVVSIPATFMDVLRAPRGQTTTVKIVEPTLTANVEDPKNTKPKQDPKPTEPVETNEIIELTIKPFAYKGDDDVAGPSMMQELADIIEVIKKHPSVKIMLTGHSDPTGAPSHVDGYLVMKRLEKLAEALTNRGVPAANITLRSCGSNYPRAYNKLQNNPYPAGQFLNRRIDVNVYSADQPLKISIDSVIVPVAVSDPSNFEFQRRNEGLSYRIQIAAIKGLYDGTAINDHTDLIIECHPPDMTYLYTLGVYSDFVSAESMRKALAEEGFAKPSINAYINGVPINLDEAKRSTLAFPDLFNYIGYKSKN